MASKKEFMEYVYKRIATKEKLREFEIIDYKNNRDLRSRNKRMTKRGGFQHC